MVDDGILDVYGSISGGVSERAIVLYALDGVWLRVCGCMIIV